MSKQSSTWEDLVARSAERKAQAEARRKASLKKGPLTQTQLALLEHLAATAVRQKAEARASKKRFQKGWTYLHFNKHVRPATLQRLLDLGLAESCCSELHGADLVRISRSGVEHLESIRGEVIYA